MKRKILLMAAIILCLSISAYGTLAFFTADGTTHNVITSGGVDIKIVEKGENGVDFMQNQTVMPGKTITKIVTVKNEGKTDAWVRVKLTPKIEFSKAYQKGHPNDIADLALMKLNLAQNDDGTGKWTLQNDGYYYYSEPLVAGQTTEALLQSVAFDAAMPNAYQNATAQVIITAEAVQSANNPDGFLRLDTVLPLDPKTSDPVPPVTDPEPTEPTEPDVDPEPTEPGIGTDDKE